MNASAPVVPSELPKFLGGSFLRHIGVERGVPSARTIRELGGNNIFGGGKVAADMGLIVNSHDGKIDDFRCKSVVVYSRCEKFRYFLQREWDGRKESLLFLTLNPDKSTSRENQPETRACQAFARENGYGGFAVCCIFARMRVKAKDRRKLSECLSEQESVGCDNDDIIREKFGEFGRMVCAWGDDGKFFGMSRVAFLGDAIKRGKIEPYCIWQNHWGLGSPENPLRSQFSS